MRSVDSQLRDDGSVVSAVFLRAQHLQSEDALSNWQLLSFHFGSTADTDFVGGCWIRN